MKVIIQTCPAESKLKAGSAYDFTGAELDVLAEAGHVWEAEATVKSREASIENAIKASKAFAPKEDTSKVRATAIKLEIQEAGLGLEYVQNLPAKSSTLSARQTSGEGAGSVSVEFGEPSIKDLVKGYLHANEPFSKELKNGGLIRATRNDVHGLEAAIAVSKQSSQILGKLAGKIQAGADFRFTEDMIKAADYADPAGGNPLGVLNTGLTLMWNLGHLENQLIMLEDIMTDISNTPVLFNQVARTRYLQIPKVMLKSTSNAWPTSGAPTGTDVDVNVVMDSHAGVPISINNNILGSTARQLLNEQKQPQLYGLGEYIIAKLVNTIVNGSTRIANDGTSTSTIRFNPAYTNGIGGHTFNVAGATLSTFVADLPAAMDLSKFPGGDEPDGAPDLMRFAWVHTSVYSGVAADTNFVLNQSIQGLKQNSGENLIQTGRFTRLGNTKFRKSQLMSDQTVISGTGADSTANGITVSPGTYSAATTAGFCGTRNSLLFVSRVPLDYTKVLPEIPSTAAVELVSSPKLGLTFMVVKHLDHAYETANMRAQLMFGQAIGDERQGMLLNVK